MSTHNPRQFRFRAPIVAAVIALAAPPAHAAVEEPYEPGDAPVTTTWYAPVSAAGQRVDREYVAGMRPHHAGALTMSQEYLSDQRASSPLLKALARAIIVNQTFEIRVLDEVARNLDRPPIRLPFGIALQPVATGGMTSQQRFFKAPIPSAVAHAVGPVTERDVMFAMAMIIHHQGALDMARAYHANPNARNNFLGLMNVDIITDQSQEIALMRRIIAAYPGDASRIRIDPSMVHGMEGMGGHGGHASAAAPSASAPSGQGPHGRHQTAERPPGRRRAAERAPSTQRAPDTRSHDQHQH